MKRKKRRLSPTSKVGLAKPDSVAAVKDDGVENGLSSRTRLLISLGLLFHLLAVVVPPSSVPPASELEYTAMRTVGWYSDAMCLNHGYRFFSPNPGASHMMRVEIELKDGRRLPDLIYPDLKKQWPRLRYHRHFMLTSRLGGAPRDPLGRTLSESYARHLYAKHDAREVRIFGRRHFPADREAVLQGLKLSDASLYSTPYESPVGHWKCDVGAGEIRTNVELDLSDNGDATLRGKILGQMTDLSLKLQSATGQNVELYDKVSGTLIEATWIGHEMLLRYPLEDGARSSRAIIMTREPPPLVVYRGEQP